MIFITKEEIYEIFKQNDKLVKYFANFYSKNKRFIEYDDLCQVGYLGLLYAIEHFDENKNISFSTYASHCIKGYILREIEKHDTLVSIPNKTLTDLKHYLKVKNIITIEDFAKQNNTTKETLIAAIQAYRFPVYLDQPIFYEEMNIDNLLEAIADDNSTEEAAFYYKELQEKFQKIFQLIENDVFFTKREIDVLKKRFGFEGNPKTLQEIADIYGVTKERIRQSEVKILHKLRQVFSKELKPFLEYCYEYDFSHF